jgi:hypothetical protein
LLAGTKHNAHDVFLVMASIALLFNVVYVVSGAGSAYKREPNDYTSWLLCTLC